MLYVSETCFLSYDEYGDIWLEMARVYSRDVLSTPADAPLLDSPRLNPLLSDTCLVLGFVERVTMYGVTPFRVFIFTIPEDISPYSTEATPEITSTDSTLLEAILLVVTPAASPKLALLESLTPSTSTAVLNVGLPLSAAPPERISNLCAEVRDGLDVVPPGRSPAMSVTFSICTWSRAVLSTIRLVVALFPLSWAVTTTLSSMRLSSSMKISYPVISPLTVIFFSTGTYPRHEALITFSPG